MAHILLATEEPAGRASAVSELARRLVAAGHRVTFSGRAIQRTPQLDPEIEYAPLVDESSLLDRVSSLEGRGNSIEDIRNWLDAIDPDLALIDAELPMHVLIAVGSGRRVATFTSLLSVWKERGLPPLHKPVIPGKGLAGSDLGIEYLWAKFRIGRLIGRWNSWRSRGGPDRLAIIKSVAELMGVPHSQLDGRQWLIPVVFPELPMLSLNAAELEFPHRAKHDLRYTGPMLNPRRDEPTDPTTRARLEAIYAGRYSGDIPTLVYASFGAWDKGDDRGFIERLFSAVAPRPDLQVIAGLGNRVSPGAFVSVPSNVHLFDWAPQLEVLEHADIAIHHGGISSINECVMSDVPMLVYPFGFLDQPGNAARVEFHSLGIRGNRDSDSPSQIRNNLDELRYDSLYLGAVKSMSEVYRSYQQDNKGVHAVEQLLQ